MHSLIHLRVLAVGVFFAVASVIGVLGGLPASAAPGACGLSSPAFCETFDAPRPQVDRAGSLDSVVWGVSRVSSNNNNGQGQFDNWSSATQQACGSSQIVLAENDTNICNGKLIETVNDNGGQTIWAAYPRQPFDIADRTGKVTFDVGADSQGPHAAWPAFIYTDQPVPAPYGGGGAPGISDYARNSIGFSIGAGGPCTTVDKMYMTTNREPTDIRFSQDGCVQEPTAAQLAAGQLNHFEVDLNASSITVLGTDPGSSSLRQIARASNISVPLTRGLIWIEDVHYNADKFDTQRNHTFIWDNVGFDGPVLPRDLGFDVLDSRTATGTGADGLATINLGYIARTVGNQVLSVQTVPGMTTAQISAATGALLEFTWFPYAVQTLTYTLNGYPSHDVAWPYPASAALYTTHTLAVPISLSELQAGPNTITLTTSSGDGVAVANFDIILVGAGGTSGGPPPATNTPPPTNTPPATKTPVPTSTAPPTQVQQQPSFTTGSTTSPIQIARNAEIVISAYAKSATATSALIDVEVYDPAGARVYQRVYDRQAFGAGQTHTFSSRFQVPATAVTGTYTVKIGTFQAGWGVLYSWNDQAVTFTVD